MKKTKILSIIAAAILTVCALASCENATPQTSEAPKTSAVSTQTDTNAQTPTPNPTPEQTTVTAQTSTPEQTPTPIPDGGVTEELLSDAWKASKTEHWHVTVSGKKTDVGNHDLVEDECTVCGCLIFGSDEYVFVSIVNENYDEILDVEYENGELTFFIETEYTYDSEGNVTSHKSTNFGKLYEEAEYEYAKIIDEIWGEEFTYTYCSKLTKYNDDGTRIIERYNEKMHLVKSITYDVMGAVKAEASFEYICYEDGFINVIKKYVGGRIVLETVYSSFEEGHMIVKQIVYNEDGTTTEWDVIPPTQKN